MWLVGWDVRCPHARTCHALAQACSRLPAPDLHLPLLQPRVVFVDTDTLLTLPDRELASGISEIVKWVVVGQGLLRGGCRGRAGGPVGRSHGPRFSMGTGMRQGRSPFMPHAPHLHSCAL